LLFLVSAVLRLILLFLVSAIKSCIDRKHHVTIAL
jgi:hypothetical protein